MSYVTHQRRLLRSICDTMEDDLQAKTLRDRMKKASAICQRMMLLLDTGEVRCQHEIDSKEVQDTRMTREEQIRIIAAEVDDSVRKPDTARFSCEKYFVAAHQALSEATYAGRDEEFSFAKFREEMVLASAWCLLAADTGIEVILCERLRQDQLWGDEFDQKNTANDWHAYVAHYLTLAMRSSAQDYVVNMVKACGLCQAAVLMIDLHGSCAPRHYEDLPSSGAAEIDLCDSCCQQSDCTIAAGRTTDCTKFQPIGRE